MDHPAGQGIACSHCHEVFASRSKYDYHYRKVHQNTIRNHGGEDRGRFIYRCEDGKFNCICGKTYVTYKSLKRHHQGCQRWKDSQMVEEVIENSEQGIP